jgi:ubiquilin
MDPFMQMLSSGALGGQTGTTTTPTPTTTTTPSSVNPALLYRDQLNQLIEMGFTNSEQNLQALIATGGNIQAAINRMLS